MKFTLMTLFTAIAVVDAIPRRLNNGQLLYPEDVGALHTEAFETLSGMYAVKKPTSRAEMMKDAGNIMTAYCNQADSECVAYVRSVTKDEFKKADNGPRSVSYPEHFDAKLKESMDKVNFVVASVKNSVTIDDAVSELAAIKKEVEDMVDVNEGYKVAVLSAISVASESLKLWHAVYSDPGHALHGMHLPSYHSSSKGGDRRLDEEEEDSDEEDNDGAMFDPYEIIMADFKAALDAATESFEDDGVDPTAILVAAAAAAIPASIGAVFGDDDDEDEDEEDEDSEEE